MIQFISSNDCLLGRITRTFIHIYILHTGCCKTNTLYYQTHQISKHTNEIHIDPNYIYALLFFGVSYWIFERETWKSPSLVIYSFSSQSAVHLSKKKVSFHLKLKLSHLHSFLRFTVFFASIQFGHSFVFFVSSNFPVLLLSFTRIKNVFSFSTIFFHFLLTTYRNNEVKTYYILFDSNT